MDNLAVAELELAYDRTLLAHLQRYQDALIPYGRMRERPCGHVCWDLVRDLQCIACAGIAVDHARWRQVELMTKGWTHYLDSVEDDLRATTADPDQQR